MAYVCSLQSMNVVSALAAEILTHGLRCQTASPKTTPKVVEVKVEAAVALQVLYMIAKKKLHLNQRV